MLRHGSTIPMVEHEAVISRVQQQRNDGKCRYRREPCGQRRHVWLAGVVVTLLLVGSPQIPAATASPATLKWASPVRADDQPPFASGIVLNLEQIRDSAIRLVGDYDVRTTSVLTPVGLVRQNFRMLGLINRRGWREKMKVFAQRLASYRLTA